MSSMLPTSLAGPSRPRTAPHRKTARSLVVGLLSGAPLCWTAAAALSAIWLFEHSLIGSIRDHRIIGYLAFGGLPNADIVGRGSPTQLWRFVSSGLLHDVSTPSHLAVNLVALLLIGSRIERWYGRLVTLAVLILGVMAGGMVWMVASGMGLAAVPDYSVGCSAGVAALIGVMLVHGYRARDDLGEHGAHAVRAQAALAIAVMLLLGLVVPNLNDTAHAGGLAVGILAALALPARADQRGRLVGPCTGVLLTAIVATLPVAVVFAAANLAGRLSGVS